MWNRSSQGVVHIPQMAWCRLREPAPWALVMQLAARLRGIADDHGRIMVVMVHNTDMMGVGAFRLAD